MAVGPFDVEACVSGMGDAALNQHAAELAVANYVNVGNARVAFADAANGVSFAVRSAPLFLRLARARARFAAGIAHAFGYADAYVFVVSQDSVVVLDTATLRVVAQRRLGSRSFKVSAYVVGRQRIMAVSDRGHLSMIEVPSFHDVPLGPVPFPIGGQATQLMESGLPAWRTSSGGWCAPDVTGQWVVAQPGSVLVSTSSGDRVAAVPESLSVTIAGGQPTTLVPFMLSADGDAILCSSADGDVLWLWRGTLTVGGCCRGVLAGFVQLALEVCENRAVIVSDGTTISRWSGLSGSHGMSWRLPGPDGIHAATLDLRSGDVYFTTRSSGQLLGWSSDGAAPVVIASGLFPRARAFAGPAGCVSFSAFGDIRRHAPLRETKGVPYSEAPKTRCVGLSDSGSLIDVTADGTLRLLALGDLRTARELKCSDAPGRSFVVLSDAQRVVAAFEDGTCVVCDIELAAVLSRAVLPGCGSCDQVDLASIREGRTLIVSGGVAREWQYGAEPHVLASLAADSVVEGFRGCRGAVALLVELEDGHAILDVRRGATVKVSDADYAAPFAVVPLPGSYAYCVFSSDGAVLFADARGVPHCVQVRSGIATSCFVTRRGHVVAGFSDGHLECFDARGRSLWVRHWSDGPVVVRGVAAESEWCAVTDGHGVLRIVTAESGEQVAQWCCDGTICGPIALVGSRLAYCDDAGIVTLLQIAPR